jgi:cobalt-zinc-cadmium efflux system protein
MVALQSPDGERTLRMTGQHQHGNDVAHHYHHGHGAGPEAGHAASAGAGSSRRLIIAFVILALFTLVEAAGGYLANSIALLAEAAHMLADCASLLLAIIAIRVSERPPDLRRTYGHRRYQPLAAFVNGQVLLLLTAWVVYEALLRIVHLPPVEGRLMLGVALLGALAQRTQRPRPCRQRPAGLGGGQHGCAAHHLPRLEDR